MSGVKIKICGLFRGEDAAYVNAAMPDYAGFVFYAKSRRAVTADMAAALRGDIHPDIGTVGVFVRAPREEIVSLCRAGIIGTVQLHGGEGGDYITALRRALGPVPIWAAFTVRAAEDLRRAAQSKADLVLLDNGYGTGETFDWSLIGDLGRPFFLAGGLTPQNIPDAVRLCRPYGVDLSSGVETEGVKDAEKIAAAVAAARGGVTP